MPLHIQESLCVVLRKCGDEDVTAVSLSCVDEYESYEPVQHSTVQKNRPRPIKGHIVAVITRPGNCIWKMLKKKTKKCLIIQLFTNILHTVLPNYCYYY